MARPVRRLIVNADDFGFTRDVNEGILEAHQRGILRAASLLATGPAFEHAVELARRTPSLDVGAHLALVGMPSALDGRPLPATVAELLRVLAGRRIRIYEELAAQMRRLCDAGVRPSHLDTHKHTHLIPAVLEAVVGVARQFGVRWIRRPFDFRWRREPAAPWGERAATRLLGLLRRSFDRRLALSGLCGADHFVGLQMTGRFGAADLVQLFHALPQGTTEFMCHPGRCGPELLAARTRLKASRERELAALRAPEVLAAAEESRIELASFRDLDLATHQTR